MLDVDALAARPTNRRVSPAPPHVLKDVITLTDNARLAPGNSSSMPNTQRTLLRR